MAYSTDQDTSPRMGIARPEPFASLTANNTGRGRAWLRNLLTSPFRDQDERATYRLAGNVSDATNRAGMRVSAKAWNGNGAPVADPPRSIGFNSVDPRAVGR